MMMMMMMMMILSHLAHFPEALPDHRLCQNASRWMGENEQDLSTE